MCESNYGLVIAEVKCTFLPHSSKPNSHAPVCSRRLSVCLSCASVQWTTACWTLRPKPLLRLEAFSDRESLASSRPRRKIAKELSNEEVTPVKVLLVVCVILRCSQSTVPFRHDTLLQAPANARTCSTLRLVLSAYERCNTISSVTDLFGVQRSVVVKAFAVRGGVQGILHFLWGSFSCVICKKWYRCGMVAPRGAHRQQLGGQTCSV